MPFFFYTYRVSEKSTATEGEDFRILTGSSISKGLTFPIEIFKDDLVEDTEKIVLEISLNCGDDPIEISMDVIDLPGLIIDFPVEQAVCQGTSIELHPIVNGGSGNYQFLWSDGASTPTKTVSPTDNSSYRVSISDGCEQTIAGTTSSILTYASNPTISTQIEQTACTFDYQILAANFVEPNTLGLKLEWHFKGASPQNVHGEGSHQFRYVSTGRKELLATVSSEGGCFEPQTFNYEIIMENCEVNVIGLIEEKRPDFPILVPKDSIVAPGKMPDQSYYISPNGSIGLPRLVFPNLQLADFNDNNQLVISNTLGQIIYQRGSYQNDWDGNDQNGRSLPSGTYYYFLQYGKQNKFVQSGKILLVN